MTRHVRSTPGCPGDLTAPPWAPPAGQVALDLDPAAGQTPDEAARHLIPVGENRLAEHKTWSPRDDSYTRWQ